MNHSFDKNRKNQVDVLMQQKGLTLIEVIIVVFIISIILAIIIPNYAASTKKAKEKLCEASVRMVNAQIELYRIDIGEMNETTADGVFSKLISAEYLSEKPACASEVDFVLNDKGLIKWPTN